MKVRSFLPLLLAAAAVPGYAEWHVAAYLGATHTQNSNVHIRQPVLANDLTFRDVSYRGESFHSPQYYGLRSGYFFARHLGIEAEFIHLKVFANLDRPVQTNGMVSGIPITGTLPMGAFVQRFSVSHGLNLLLVNVVARKQLYRSSREGLGRLIINARAGVGGTIPHAETEIAGLPDQHYQWGRVAFQAAAGGEIHLWRNLYALSEYKYTQTDQHFRVSAGNASTLLRSHHGVFGLGIHF